MHSLHFTPYLPGIFPFPGTLCVLDGSLSQYFVKRLCVPQHKRWKVELHTDLRLHEPVYERAPGLPRTKNVPERTNPENKLPQQGFRTNPERTAQNSRKPERATLFSYKVTYVRAQLVSTKRITSDFRHWTIIGFLGYELISLQLKFQIRHKLFQNFFLAKTASEQAKLSVPRLSAVEYTVYQ